jgi:hypothetical protein
VAMSIFFIFHHRLECTLRARTIRIGRCFQQYAWGDLPEQASFVLAPPARALGAAIADDGMPVAIGLGLVLGDAGNGITGNRNSPFVSAHALTCRRLFICVGQRRRGRPTPTQGPNEVYR